MQADRIVFGNFLGETYSLSQILRLECMNSLPFEHTGVVEALKLVGERMVWPGDFEKLDRLTFCQRDGCPFDRLMFQLYCAMNDFLLEVAL